MEAMEHLMKGRTSLMIAHRLTTLNHLRCNSRNRGRTRGVPVEHRDADAVGRAST